MDMEGEVRQEDAETQSGVEAEPAETIKMADMKDEVKQEEGEGENGAGLRITKTEDAADEEAEMEAEKAEADEGAEPEIAESETADEGEAEDAAPTKEEIDAKPKEGMDWYVLHTYSGYEKKVKEQLRQRLKHTGLENMVGRIEIPEERVVEIKGGRKKESNRMFFPGYVLIEMAMNEKIWYVVKDTPRITGFLGDAHLPVPLSIEEVTRIKEQMTGVADKPRPKHSYDVGEPVRVTDGPFANFSGVLEEVNMDRGKVKVMVSIFGRSTPVELEFSQIEKI